MHASAIQIQAIIGYGCDWSLSLYKIVVAIKSSPITDMQKSDTKTKV